MVRGLHTLITSLLIVISSKCKVWFKTTKRKRLEAPPCSYDTQKRIRLTTDETVSEPTHITEAIEEHIDEESDSEIDFFRNVRVRQTTVYRGQLLEEYIKDYRRLPKKRQMMFRRRMERALFERRYASEQINRALNQRPSWPSAPTYSSSFPLSYLEGYLSQHHTTFNKNEDVTVPNLVQDDPIKVHRKHAPPYVLDSFNIGWEEDMVSLLERVTTRSQPPLFH